MPKLRKAASDAEMRTADDIRQMYGNMLGIKDVQDYLGVSRHTAEKWLADVDAVMIVRTKKYPALDIAKKIVRNRIPGGSL